MKDGDTSNGQDGDTSNGENISHIQRPDFSDIGTPDVSDIGKPDVSDIWKPDFSDILKPVDSLDADQEPDQRPVLGSLDGDSYWDTDNRTDFKGQLKEVSEPVFEREAVVKIQLKPREIEALNEIAKSKGVASVDLIREWVLEKIQVS